MSPLQLSLVFLVLALPRAHARRSGRALRESALAAEAQALTQKTASTEQASAEAMLEGMAGRALSKMGVRFSEITAFAKRFKTIEEKALRKLAGKVPTDVESIVRLSVEGQDKNTGASSPLTDAAIAKGRVYLNNLAYQSVLKTDDIIWECKEFELRNRGAYEQASTDSARLASQLTALQSKRVDSNECVARYDSSYRSVEEQSEKTTLDYNSKRETDSLELTRRKNDLAVFEFLINVTKCPADSSSSSSGLLQMQGSNSMKICQTPAGTELAFSDPRVQAQFEQKLTPTARETLRSMLGTASGPLGFLQLGAKEAVETTTTTAIIAAPLITPMQRPVNNWEKCVDMPAGDGGPEGPPCAKIHDKISLEWGVYKDSVDILATEMATDTQNHEAATANYNGQMTQINDAKTLCMETLATAISANTKHATPNIIHQTPQTTPHTPLVPMAQQGEDRARPEGFLGGYLRGIECRSDHLTREQLKVRLQVIEELGRLLPDPEVLLKNGRPVTVHNKAEVIEAVLTILQKYRITITVLETMIMMIWPWDPEGLAFRTKAEACEAVFQTEGAAPDHLGVLTDLDVQVTTVHLEYGRYAELLDGVTVLHLMGREPRIRSWERMEEGKWKAGFASMNAVLEALRVLPWSPRLTLVYPWEYQQRIHFLCLVGKATQLGFLWSRLILPFIVRYSDDERDAALHDVGMPKIGQTIEYLSLSKQDWVVGNVIGIRPETAEIMIDLRPKAWMGPQEWAGRIRKTHKRGPGRVIQRSQHFFQGHPLYRGL